MKYGENQEIPASRKLKKEFCEHDQLTNVVQASGPSRTALTTGWGTGDMVAGGRHWWGTGPPGVGSGRKGGRCGWQDVDLPVMFP